MNKENEARKKISQICAYCAKEACFKCSDCENYAYCSVNCQHSDWNYHRNRCQIKDSENWSSKRAVSLLNDDDNLTIDNEKSLRNLKVNVSFNRVMPSLKPVYDTSTGDSQKNAAFNETVEKFSRLYFQGNRVSPNKTNCVMNTQKSAAKVSVNSRLARAQASVDVSKAVKPEEKMASGQPKTTEDFKFGKVEPIAAKIDLQATSFYPVHDHPLASGKITKYVVEDPKSPEKKEKPAKPMKNDEMPSKSASPLTKAMKNLEIPRQLSETAVKSNKSPDLPEVPEKTIEIPEKSPELVEIQEKSPEPAQVPEKAAETPVIHKKSKEPVETPKPATPLREKSLKAASVPKWKSHVPIPDNQIPFQVVVTHLTEKSIWVTPKNDHEDLLEYLETMTQFYWENSEGLGRVSPGSCKIGDLLIYPFDEDYLYRAEVIEVTPKTKIRLIDIGCEGIFDENMEVYRALGAEKGKPAFAVEIFPRSPEVIKKIEVDMDIVLKIVSDPQDKMKVAKIRFLKEKVADLETTGEDSSLKVEDQSLMDASLSFATSTSRLMANSLLQKDLTVGKNISIFLLEVSKLEQGDITICEHNDINTEFYDSLETEVSKFGQNNPNLFGYVPVVNELVLVQEEDSYSRAICKAISLNRATLLSIDYGKILVDVPIARIMKLPLALLFTCCALEVKVRGLQDLVAEKTKKEIEKIKNSILMENVVADKIEKVKEHNGYQYYVDISIEKIMELIQ